MRALAVSLLAAAVLAPPAAGAEAGPPGGDAAEAARVAEGGEAFSVVVEQVEAILADTGASPDGKRARVAYLLDRWLDLAFMSRAALGQHAERFSPVELTDFSHEFGRYVVSIYLRRIARAEGGFEVLGASWQARSRTVMVSTRGGRPIADHNPQFRRGAPGTAQVDYRLRKRRGEWRILSIVIDGVDTVRLFQGQFEAALESHGPDEIVARLRTRNAEMEAHNPFAP